MNFGTTGRTTEHKHSISLQGRQWNLVCNPDPQNTELSPTAALDPVWITCLDPVMFIEIVSIERQSWSLFSEKKLTKLHWLYTAEEVSVVCLVDIHFRKRMK